MNRIIIVEDEPNIRQELSHLLNANGYEADTIIEFNKSTEELSAEILTRKPDLILLDVNLPEQSGLHLCDVIRSSSTVPIIFVTANNTSMDELNCILRGGDDYIAKPYQVPILLARIANVLKRASGQTENQNRKLHKGLTLLLAEARASYQNQEVSLTRNELKILNCLFDQKDKFVSRTDLIGMLWDNQVFIDDNALSVNVTRIREKLASIGCEGYIETRRGMGYRI